MATERRPSALERSVPKKRLILVRCAITAALGCAAITAAQWVAAAENVGELQIDATGFRSQAGHAEAKLFRKGENVLGVPQKRLRAVPHQGKASFVFSGLPYGEYAVVVFHDENENGKIDHNFLGLPSEPLGFSNGFVPGLIAGLPSFEKLRFAFGARRKLLRISVK